KGYENIIMIRKFAVIIHKSQNDIMCCFRNNI
ncbi:MAG: hypothetical protein Edafosvirus18_22, partial [Edafosvirus sp.]